MNRYPLLPVRLALAIAVIGVAAGCGPHIQCAEFPGGDECERIADAAIAEIPPGASSVIVESDVGAGIPTPPIAVLACYPDREAVAVGVTLTAGGAVVAPWDGDLPFECDP